MRPRRAWPLAIAGLAACGRLGFDPVRDGGGNDDAPDAPFAQTCAMRTVNQVPVGGIVTGSATAGGGNATGSCGGGGSDDAVYAIDLVDDESSLLVAADLPGSTSDTLIHIRRDCDDPSTEVACDVSGGANEDAAQRLIKPGIGRYHVFIEAEPGGAGLEYEASIQILRALGHTCGTMPGREICGPDLTCMQGTCQPAACPSASTISVATLGTSNIMLDTTMSLAAHAGSCGEGNDGGVRAPESILTIDLQLAARLEISTASPLTSFDTLIYLRATCSGPEIVCDDDGGAVSGNGQSTFTTAMLPIGSYLLFVDGFAVRRGTADVTVRAF